MLMRLNLTIAFRLGELVVSKQTNIAGIVECWMKDVRVGKIFRTTRPEGEHSAEQAVPTIFLLSTTSCIFMHLQSRF
jgi:hypothetical protein